MVSRESRGRIHSNITIVTFNMCRLSKGFLRDLSSKPQSEIREVGQSATTTQLGSGNVRTRACVFRLWAPRLFLWKRKEQARERKKKQRANKGKGRQTEARLVEGWDWARRKETGPPRRDGPPTLVLRTHTAAPGRALGGEEKRLHVLEHGSFPSHGAHVNTYTHRHLTNTYTCKQTLTPQTHTNTHPYTHTQVLTHTQKQTNATIPRYTDLYKLYIHTDTHMLSTEKIQVTHTPAHTHTHTPAHAHTFTQSGVVPLAASPGPRYRAQ